MKEGWHSSKLGDVCDMIKRGIAPKYTDQGGLCVLNQRCVRDHLINFLLARLHDTSKKRVPEERIIRQGDVLVNSTGVGTLGRVAQLRSASTEPVTVDTHVTIVRPKQGMFYPEFFGYMLVHIEGEIESSGEGASGQTELARTTLSEKFQVRYPDSHAEQKRIVAILDEAFGGIATAVANAGKNLANARELFESHLNAVFSQKGDGWVEKTLGDVCIKMEYGTSTKSKPEGSVPVLRMGNIQNGRIDWKNLVFSDDKEEIAKYQMRHNDVLFNRTNSAEHVGKTAIYKSKQPAIFAGYLIRIHRQEDLLDADFLNLYLNGYAAREYGRSVMSRSVNQANINGSKLKAYPISLPPIATQRKIATQLSNLSIETKRLESIYQQKLDSLAELKQSILQKAFAGELTSKPDNVFAEVAL
jgi:type I restriction enzyme, S subunit